MKPTAKELQAIVARVDKGQTTLKQEARKYPVHYHTFRKWVFRFRDYPELFA